MNNKPVILGGTPVITDIPQSLHKWPIITEEDEAAVLEVLRRGAMSNIDVTKQFEEDFKKWQGREYALGFNNGTSSLLAAMWACGIGVGDEVICPTITYWASILPVYQLGGTAVFTDIDPVSLCIKVEDIEHRITPRTKAIMIVHYLGHPAEMDKIMDIGKRHGIKVIEDYSHAQGGYYKGIKVGKWGDVSATSLMAGKSLAIGEAGILVTDDKQLYERAVAFSHYERFTEDITDPWLSQYRGLPMGGVKGRMHQLSSAVGRVQLKYYDERSKIIRDAIDYFWSGLKGYKGLYPHRIDDSIGDMSGWYIPYGHYNPDELNGMTAADFAAAMRAEGVTDSKAGCNAPLHQHALFQTADIYGHGKPTRIANSTWDVREGDKSLPISEKICLYMCSVPYFKQLDKENIDKYIAAYRRVLDSSAEIVALNLQSPNVTRWFMSKQKDEK